MKTLFSPPTIERPETDASDSRVGQLFKQGVDALADTSFALLGFPSDEGVLRNGGRPGASEAPDIIRSWLYRLTPDARNLDAFQQTCWLTTDLGNLTCTGEVEEDQYILGEVVAALLNRNIIPIILGGGHETSYGHFLGYSLAEKPVAIVNLDAHADVRPLKDGKAHSGSPFRQALESAGGWCRRYTVAGLNPASTAADHADFVKAGGGRVFWRDEVNKKMLKVLYADSPDPTLASFDFDGVDQAFAPGVSAPNGHGLPVSTWYEACFQAGASPMVSSADFVEFNPRFDVDHRTGRLAALSVWHFISGLAHRPSPA